MFTTPILLLSLQLIPLFSIIILAFINNNNEKLIKNFAFISSLITFFASLLLLLNFDALEINFQFYKKYQWLLFKDFYINYAIGIDGISLFFILLTTFLIPICLLLGWEIKKYLKEYMIAFLVLEILLVNVFSVLDIMLFFIFFESVLIPMFLIIGIWGSRDRKMHAAYRLLLYTLFGSIFMILGIILIFLEVGSTDYLEILKTEFSHNRQLLLWLAFFISFAVKVPMLPFHIWLPEAHVEAPTAGSVILAGLLLKLGTYGFIRYSLPLFPYASYYFSPLVFTVSVIGIIYASLTTIRQIDLKKIIAYSSVAHMNYVTIGLFSFNIQALEGSIFLMLSHGIVSSALFICIGFLYSRHHTRLIKYYESLTTCMPILSTYFFIFTLANMSFPTTSSFIGEFLVLTGSFLFNPTVSFLASLGVILGGAYSIWLYNRIFFGYLNVEHIKAFKDLTRLEFFILLPLLIMTFFFGIYPKLILDYIHLPLSILLMY